MDEVIDPLSSRFGAVLRSLRESAGLTQKELAGRAGMSVSAVRDLEQGRSRRPRPSSVRTLAGALDLGKDQASALLSAAAAGGADRPRASGVEITPGSLRVGVLGPLTVQSDGAELPLGSGKSRAVLGRLALSANATVGLTELIDVLWSDRPPLSATSVLHVYISKIRTVLEPSRPPRARDGMLCLAPGGYQLALAEDQLDLATFRRLVRVAAQHRAARPAAALDLLDDGLALWRADPLCDVAELRGHPLLTAVVEERIAAVLCHADLAGELGCHARSLPWLRGLAAAHRLHEPLHARLVRALAAAGEQATALSVYHDIRRRLADELGIDPGPELAEAYHRVLRQDLAVSIEAVLTEPAIRPGPAQLPADIVAFAGRHDELLELDTVRETSSHSQAVTIISISGTPGVGKTTLAVHWAHRVRKHFPDGQLYVNLRGYDPSGVVMPPAEALRLFLDALGVAPQAIPVDLEAKKSLYRSLLADRRMLIVLDNARTADQVRPLLPGAADSLVVVTSRAQLTSLIAAEGAHPIAVDLLTPDQAGDFLSRRLGSSRIDAEPQAVNDIIGRCTGLPLALAIVAALAASGAASSLTSLAGRLANADRHLDALTGGDMTTDLRAVFFQSYRTLTDAAARLFRLLGLHPGPDITVPAAAGLAGVEVRRVRPLLAELEAAQLFTEHVPGRYAAHDLLRAYAAERSRSQDSEPERRAAVRRVLDHYLHTAYSAARLLDQRRRGISLPPRDGGNTPEPMADPLEAIRWFNAEFQVLLSFFVPGEATEAHDAHIWRLAWTMSDFLYFQGHWQQWVATHEVALAAATRLSDLEGRRHLHQSLGFVCARLGRHDDALTHLRHALQLSSRADDQAGQAMAHGVLGRAFELQGRHRESLHHAQEALALFRAVGDIAGQANALNSIGWEHAELGDYRRALRSCRKALALQQEIGDEHASANTLDSLGYVHHHLGQHPEAISCYQAAVEAYRRFADRRGEAVALTHLGDAHQAAGDHRAAEEVWRHALAIHRRLNHPDAKKVEAKLRRLEPLHQAPPGRSAR